MGIFGTIPVVIALCFFDLPAIVVSFGVIVEASLIPMSLISHCFVRSSAFGLLRPNIGFPPIMRTSDRGSTLLLPLMLVWRPHMGDSL